MALAIDFGNSQIKLGHFKDDLHPASVEVLQYNMPAFSKCLSKYHSTEEVIISSVAHSFEFERVVATAFEHTISLNYKLRLPFENLYETPETLGNDRMAACAGAMELLDERPLLIIDSGSCITYDFINEKDQYIGGAISPGIDMKLRAMHEFTENLPETRLTPEYQPLTIGKSTKTCLLEGAVGGTIHEIMGFAATFSKAKSLKMVLTGGNSEYLADKLENSTFAAPNLVLIGLNKIRKLNAL